MESTLSNKNLVHRIKEYKLKPQIRNLLLLAFLSLLLLSSIFFTYYYSVAQNSNQFLKPTTLTIVEEEEDNTNINTNTTEQDTESTDKVEGNTSNNKSTNKTNSTNTPSNTTVITEEPEETQPIPDPVPESPSAYVAFYADNQSDTDEEDTNHLRVVNYILAKGTNPIFHAGDIMEDGTQNSLDRFNTVTATLRATRTFYAALGNNDRMVGDSSTPSQLFLDNFSFPNNERWYSINYGNLHMVVLDSAFASSNQTQINWLISDLQSSNSQNRITGVMFHHPTYASTISTYLVNYGVDFVISGHLHSYSHTISNNIHYFVLSGQPTIGYITAKVYANHVEMVAYNSGNTVIETIQIAER